MRKTASQQIQNTSLSVDPLVSFVEAFCRIFKVGIYYPDGHAVLDQSVNACIHELREISPSLSCVKIEVERNGLFVETIDFSEGFAPVRELHLLLAKLGIRSIEIDISISHKQLLSFVTSVLTWRTKMESTQTLINFHIAELPDCIRLELLEFLVDERSILNEKSKNEQNRTLNDLCDAFKKQGFDEHQTGQCRELLEKLSESTADTEESIEGFSNVTWEDVQALLHKIITSSQFVDDQSLDTDASNDIDVISSIFESLELSLSDNTSKETIRFLLSHLSARKTDQPKTAKDSAPPQKQMRQLLNSGRKIPISELQTFIYGNNIPLKILEQLNLVDNSEEISIILQLIPTGLEKGLYEKLEQKLLANLGNRPRDREKKVLIEGIKNLANTKNDRFCRSLLHAILHSLRDSENYCSLEFLVELLSNMPQTMQLLFWPSLVNELFVVGGRENGESFLEAIMLASQIPLEGMINLSSELEEMDVFQEKIMAANIFSADYLFSYKLFAFLLGTSIGDIIAEEVLSGILAKPQDNLVAVVVPIMEISNTSHLVFLKSYLSLAHLREPPLALKMAAGQIILEYLQEISEEEKKLPGLEKTIAGMAGLYFKDMEIILYKIIKDKKMGILPAWPKNCRKAANDVLKKTKSKSLKELL